MFNTSMSCMYLNSNQYSILYGWN